LPRPANPRFVRPIDSCTFDYDGGAETLNPSDILEADHPWVRARPQLFKALEPTRQRPAVEQATAAPGEQRG
jgi:hypothetical protein